MESTIAKAIRDTQIVVLARVLEVMEQHPTMAKKIIKELYEELRAEDEEHNLQASL